MTSDVVVISWWSNCLGLACLDSIVSRVSSDVRRIHVVQVGKRADAKERFRERLPSCVSEIPYPDHEPAEHARVIDSVVRRSLCNAEGLLFVDHDVLFQDDVEPWLATLETRLGASNVGLCHPDVREGSSLTSPAFWLAHSRLPQDTPAFDMIPPSTTAVAAAPYDPASWVDDAPRRTPLKDTLWAARDFLADRNLALSFRANRFPAHEHYGGLYLLAAHHRPGVPADVFDSTVARLTVFFRDRCPSDWLRGEDETLLERLSYFGGLAGC